MVLSQGLLAGFDAGAGSRSISGIGDFIRSKLAEAKQMGLIKFQGDVQTQGALNIAQLKGDIEGADTRQGGIVGPGGQVTNITGGGGPEGRDFPSDFKFITPREGATEGERNLKSARAQLTADLLKEESPQGNVIEEGGAKGSATPVTSIIKSQAPREEIPEVLSPEERELEELLKLLGG